MAACEGVFEKIPWWALIDYSIACAIWQWSLAWKLSITGHVLYNIFGILPFLTTRWQYGELVHEFCFNLYSAFRFTICKAPYTCYSILAVKAVINEENVCWVCGWARIMQCLPLQLCTICEEPPYHRCHLTFSLLGQHFWTLFGRCTYPLVMKGNVISAVHYKHKFYISYNSHRFHFNIIFDDYGSTPAFRW
jgi:hypothetical protein